MKLRTKKLTPILLALLLISACSLDDGTARFSLSGKSKLDAHCFTRAFPLDAQILAARDSESAVSLFFQSSTAEFDQINGVYIQIYKPDEVRKNLATPIPLSPPETVNAIVGGKITLFAACPDILNSYYLDGEITFTKLEKGKNAHVVGTITDARILNTRTHDVVAEGFSGSWDFTTQRGQPAQTFYALP